jgi:16S rRNA (guanine966-N2)-methyltransferase
VRGRTIGRVPLRVVAGSVGGRRLVAPKRGTRPTADRVKEALFAALDVEGVAGAAVLDLYAGSGALGIEALSRGATSAVFVDRDRHAEAAIRANLATTGLEASAKVVRAPAGKFLQRASRDEFDLVFLDPPYDIDARELSLTLRALAEGEALAPGATVVIEASRRSPPQLPEGWSVRWERAYGDTLITVATP